MGKDKPGKHDPNRDGHGIYQPNKTQKPKDHGTGQHGKDDPKRDR